MVSLDMAKHWYTLTFKRRLNPDSPIYEMLHVLPLMNMEVSDDNLTADKNYKHIFKQLRNLLLRDKGHNVHGVHIKLAILHSHFTLHDLSSTQINYLLNPNDWQDVKLAYEMLQEVWSLPDSPPDVLPGFHQARSPSRF